MAIAPPLPCVCTDNHRDRVCVFQLSSPLKHTSHYPSFIVLQRLHVYGLDYVNRA